MDCLWIGAAFLLFMAVLGSAHALDRWCAGRYGYRPFGLPNLAFMLIPHGILAAAAASLGPAAAQPALGLPPVVAWLLAGLAAGALIFMHSILARRTNGWVATAATTLMTLAAPVLLFSVLFRELAEMPPGPGH